MGSQQFCLKWSNHHSNIVTVFEELLSNEALVDVTLACEGLSLKAHKMVLSACSPFFQSLFVENPCKHPIVIMKDIKYSDLKAIVDFMYRGEVNISHDQMSAFLKTAETLRVKGLAMLPDDTQQDTGSSNDQGPSLKSIEPSYGTSLPKQSHQRKIRSPLPRRKRRTSQSSESSVDKTDEHPPAKIKERDSPEIIEEFSRDSGSDHFANTQSRAKSATSQNSTVTETAMAVAISQSNAGQRTQMSTSENSQSMNMQTVSLAENTYSRDVGVEQRVPASHETQSIIPFSLPTASQALLPVTSNAESLSHFSGSGPNSSEEQLVLPSGPSEPSTSSHDDSICIDVKPTLVAYGEPPVTGEAGPSHMQESSSTLLFRNPLDTLAETSGSQGSTQDAQYQSDQQASQVWLDSARLQLEDGGSLQCPVCGKVLSRKQTLLMHMERHDKVRRFYSCHLCSQAFVWRASLLRHLKNKHETIPDTSGRKGAEVSPVPTRGFTYGVPYPQVGSARYAGRWAFLPGRRGRRPLQQSFMKKKHQ